MLLSNKSMREKIIEQIKDMKPESIADLILDNKLSYMTVRNEMIKEDFYSMYQSMPTMEIYTELEFKYRLSVNSIMLICKGRY